MSKTTCSNWQGGFFMLVTFGYFLTRKPYWKKHDCSNEYKNKNKWKLLPCWNFGWSMVTFIEDESNRWALVIKVFSFGVLLHKVFKPYYHRKSNTIMWKKLMLLTYKENLNTNKFQVHVSCANWDWKIIYKENETSWRSCNF